MWLKPLALVHLTALSAFAAPKENTETTEKSITWADCPEDIGTPAQCGTLAVPLDYTDESAGPLNLTLLKVKATKEPSKGSIIYNPGGPGLPGATSLAGEWPIILALTGGSFDLIGFDSRGTGETIPIDCFPDPTDRFRWELLTPASSNASDTAVGVIWSQQKAYAESCQVNGKEVGELVSSTFVARDMMQIVDALGEDGLLRYFGQSYGTLLGETAAAMFPERIDRMVLDGVINPHEYYDGWEYEPLSIGDVTLKKLLEQCVEAGKPACALAAPNATVESLQATIYDLVNQVKFEPIVLGTNVTTDIVGMKQLLDAMNTPFRMLIDMAIPFAGYIQAILDRNVTAYNEYRVLLGLDSTLLPIPTLDAAQAIRCSDSVHRAEELNEDVLARVEKLDAQSPLFAQTFTGGYFACSSWKMEPKERFTDFSKKKTKHPLLLVGSPYDVRTPIVSAHNASASFEGSVVLQHNGLGHCIMYSPGQCAIEKVKQYFEEGTLPEPGTVCEQDFGVFSGKGVADSFGLGGGEGEQE